MIRAPARLAGGGSARHGADLVLHLTGRRLRSSHRLTLLGWLWPLARQLAQLAVFVFVFSHVLDLGIPDYPLFVFTGFLLWSWFSTALTMASTSLLADRHLVFSPRLPNRVLPLVAVAIPLVDALVALPVMLALLVAEGQVHATILLLPLLLALLFALVAGLGLAVAALNVYVRDVESLVAVGLLMLFYLTPVFYGLRNVPEQFHWLIQLNPMTAAISAARAVTVEGALPALGDVAQLAGAGALALAIGLVLFGRLEGGFVDEL